MFIFQPGEALHLFSRELWKMSARFDVNAVFIFSHWLMVLERIFKPTDIVWKLKEIDKILSNQTKWLTCLHSTQAVYQKCHISPGLSWHWSLNVSLFSSSWGQFGADWELIHIWDMYCHALRFNSQPPISSLKKINLQITQQTIQNSKHNFTMLYLLW